MAQASEHAAPRRVARNLLTVASLAGALACAHTDARTPAAIPDTPAGRAFRAWLDAYDAADSARLEAYVRLYEPTMSSHTQLVFREQTGPWEIASIERSEPRHLEVVLRTRAESTVGLVPLTMYGVVDVTGDPRPRAATTLSYVGNVTGMRPPRISAEQRAVAIDSVIAKTVRNYVFLNVANEIADSLRARRARGEYATYLTEAAFAARLSRDLRELAGERQIGVEYAWRLPLPPSPPSSPAMLHCGIEPAKLLDRGVAYLKLYGFGLWGVTCGNDISAALTSIADSRALILDLRDNADDGPDARAAMAYVASYLVGSCTHLGDVVDRRTTLTDELWTRSDLPGRQFGGTKPLYILTSARTFSAGEELAYDLQSLRRATIVGERTGGGAHVAAVGPVGVHMLVHIPFARTVNPLTRTNWYRAGVQPDVIVPASEALNTAERLEREGRAPPSTLASLGARGSLPAAAFAGTSASSTQPTTLRAVRFGIDTVVQYAASRGVLSRVAGVVEFAEGRGRLDVTAVSSARAVSLSGVVIGQPLASRGDYYLFDNTGFILVRPATRTFSSFAFTRADFNHTGALLPGAFLMGYATGARAETLPAGDAEAGRQHAPIGIQWHMQARSGPPPDRATWNMYARGWLDIADAPAVEAGVARWFEVAAALATRSADEPPISPDNLEITSITRLHNRDAHQPIVTWGEQLQPLRLSSVGIDPSRLTLPAGYTETRWPGFERVRDLPTASATTPGHWRVLEDVASQRARSACTQAWLPEGIGGSSADTARTARSVNHQSALR